MVYRKNTNGFTLTELLIVITIIGTLASLVIVNFRSAQMRGRDGVRKSDLRNIQTALRLYYNDFGRYPSSAPAAGGAIVGCGTVAAPASCTYGSVWTKAGTTYMSILPDEPLKTPDYVYTYVNDDDYTLRACLESRSDPKGVVVTASICTSLLKYEVKP
jgi:prepilin-type N-terminal cleavage/methylation domain-containing protein